MKTLLSAVVGATLALCAIEADAQTAAGERQVALATESKTLAEALDEWAQKSGFQIIVQNWPLAKRLSAPTLNGTFRAQDALERLLRGSPLTYVWLNDRAVAIRENRQDATSSLGETTDDEWQPKVRLAFLGDAADAMNGAASKDSTSSVGHERRRDVSEVAPIDEIVVTGTHIRGASPPGSSLIVVDSQYIESTGFATVQEVMRTLPQNFSGGTNEASSLGGRMGGTSVNYNYGSSVNLRGLGQDSTLVLLNGRRLAPAGIGDFIDVSVIPLSAIDHVDVLADGASATYGSDAMAGVVNITTKSDFQGGQTSARYGSVTEGTLSEVQASQLVGLKWDTGSIMAAFDYYDRDNLSAAARAYAASTDLRGFGGRDFRNNFSNPGNITSPSAVAGAIPVDQDGTALSQSQILVGQTNLQNQRQGTDLLPKQRRRSIFASGKQQLGSSSELHLDAIYSQRDSLAAISAGTDTLSVPATNAFRQQNGLLAGNPAPISINYSFVDDVGPQVRDGETRAYAATAGLTFDFGRTWSIDLSASSGENRDRSHLTGTPDTRPLASGGALRAALASSDAATAFNPFGDGGHTAPAVLASIFAPIDIEYRSKFWSADAVASGSLFSLPAGDVKLAMGTEYREEDFNNSQVTHYVTGDESPITPRGDRTVRSAFGELRIPLFDVERIAGVGRADLSLSARYDDYSDFGSKTNPKVGLAWLPLPSITLRGTYGTSFKAPRINDLYTLSTGLAVPVPTVLGGPDSNGDGFTRLLVVGGGNAQLKPETGETWTAGLEWSPATVPGLRAQASYWDVHFEDRIARLATLLVPFANPAPYQGLVYFVNPSQSQVDALIASVDTFTGAPPPPGTVEAIVDLRVANISVVDVEGVDLGFGYTFDTSAGAFTFSTNASYVLSFEERFAPLLPPVDTVDTIAHPVALRARAGLSWHYKNLRASLAVNYQDSYKNTEILPNEAIDSMTTADLQLVYSTDSTSPRSEWLSGIKVALTVVNLSDEDPPFTNSALGGYDAANATPLGRFLALELTKSW